MTKKTATKLRQAAEVKRLRAKHPGITNTEIAARMNLSPSTITHIAQVMGWRGRKRGPKTALQTLRIARYMRKHPKETLTAVAALYGVSRQRVAEIRERHNKKTGPGPNGGGNGRSDSDKP